MKWHSRNIRNKQNQALESGLERSLQTIHKDMNMGNYMGEKRVWWYTGDYIPSKLYLQFYHEYDEKLTECTDEELKLIVKGLKFARQCFEKRLDAYLKRYGTKKLHTWTYWADA